MPKRTDIKKIMVIGSGPIIIGQAAEFDYAGTQACLALREEGYEVVLVNSNPATIMTDKEIADKVYIEPITLEFVSRILRKELPDAIVPTLGGQTGLNMAMELAASGILDELEIELLGTKLSAIDQAEDRDLFRQLMHDLNEPVPESDIVHTVEEAVDFSEKIGLNKVKNQFEDKIWQIRRRFDVIIEVEGNYLTISKYKSENEKIVLRRYETFDTKDIINPNEQVKECFEFIYKLCNSNS